MRNLVLSLAAMLTIAAVACGPSSKEVATAKSARYQGDKLEIFANVKAATEAKYKLHKSDETSLGMETEPRWFSVEGLAVTPRGDDMRDVPDKSINIALVVRMLPDGDKWIISVTPVMARYNRGIPKPEPLKENDPSLPGWVQGKVDELSLDIHKALGKFEVKTVPGSVPAPAPAPGPAPDEPATGSAAAEGSAPGAPAGSAAPQ